jgi:hypothetical protein
MSVQIDEVRKTIIFLDKTNEKGEMEEREERGKKIFDW